MVLLGICVMTTIINPFYTNQLKSVLETWYQDALDHHLLIRFYVGNQTDSKYPLTPLPGVGEDYQSAFLKQFLGLKDLYQEDPDFLLVVGTDNYVVLSRLLQDLEQWNPDDPLYLGGHGLYRQLDQKAIYFHSGAAGFILSRGGMKKILPHLDHFSDRWREICQRNNSLYLLPAGDVALGYLVQSEGIEGIQTIKLPHFHGCNYRGYFRNEFRCCTDHIDLDQIRICHYMTPQDNREYRAYLLNQKRDDYSEVSSIDPYLTGIISIYQPADLYYLEPLIKSNLSLVIRTRLAFRKKLLKMSRNRKEKGQPLIFYSSEYKLGQNSKRHKKLEDLEEILQNNPFKSSYFFCLEPELAVHLSSLKSFLSDLVDFDPARKDRRAYFLMADLKYVSTTFFSGSKESLLEMISLSKSKESNCLGLDLPGIEVSPDLPLPTPDLEGRQLAQIADPSRFRIRFGGPLSPLLNYKSIVNLNGNEGLNIYQRIILQAQAQENHPIINIAAEALIAAYDQGEIELNLGIYFNLLDIYLIASWWSNNREKYPQIVQRFAQSIDQEEFRQNFLNNYDRILDNLDYVYWLFADKEWILVKKDLSPEEIDTLIKDSKKVFIYEQTSLSASTFLTSNPIRRAKIPELISFSSVIE